MKLTGKEYAMLELLSLRKGSAISKESFMSHLYGGRDEPEMKIIDVFICKLRRKVGFGMIETVWGRGYVLREPKQEWPSMQPELRDMCDSTDFRGGLRRGALMRETIEIECPPLQSSGT